VVPVFGRPAVRLVLTTGTLIWSSSRD